MEMMDHARRRFATPAPAAPAPMVITTGLPLRGPGSLASQFYSDGTRKPRRKPRDEYGDPDFDEFEEDGARRRRRVQTRDPQGREAGTFEEEDRAFADHRPGFRQVTAADRAKVDDAYLEMCRDLCDAWKTPDQRAVDHARSTADACPAGVDPRAWAYNQMVRDLTDAWRPDPAKEGAAAPKILPVDAMPKHIGTVKAGDACMVDGADGVYVDGGDGNLYCLPRPMPTTRTAPTSPIDAMPARYMSASDAQPIRDRAYQEYVDHVCNAWKQP